MSEAWWNKKKDGVLLDEGQRSIRYLVILDIRGLERVVIGRRDGNRLSDAIQSTSQVQ